MKKRKKDIEEIDLSSGKKKKLICVCPRINEFSILASPTCPIHYVMTRLGAAR